MTLLNTIFQFEWRQLFRQRWMMITLVLYTTLALVAVSLCRGTVSQRMAQADSIATAYQRDYQAALKRFGDTLTEKGKAEAINTGNAAVVNFRLPQNAVKPPAPLSALSAGLSDIQPWHLPVRYTTDYREQTVAPVSNPMMMQAGNFDLAFVIVYMLPLLVLAFCYNLYASEQQYGTLPLIAIYAGSVHQVLLYKMLFRWLVLGVMLTCINVLAFAMAPGAAAPSGAMVLWCLLSLLYLLFWMVLAYVVIALRAGPAKSALILLSCWIFLLVALPSLLNTIVQSRHPVPLKDEVAAFRRHQSEEIWASSPRALVDSFNLYHPEYAASADPAKDTVKLSSRFITGYYDMLDRRMQQVLVPYQQRIDRRNRALWSLSVWDPAMLVQQWFNMLSGNELEVFRDFDRQAARFQQQWQAYLYQFYIPDKLLTPADFARFPVFAYQPAALPTGELLLQAGALLTATLLLGACGYILFAQKKSL